MGCCYSQLAPKRDPKEPDSYIPSTMAMNDMAKNGTCMFKEITVEKPYAGGKKILVICTTKYLMEMANGKLFNTGHQASETLVPMYHMDKCGFEFDIATPDGGKVALEEWTFPSAHGGDPKTNGYEDKIRGLLAKYQQQFDQPMKCDDIPDDLEPYAALFFPGGHGPVIEQGKQPRIGELLRTANKMAFPTISLCHGPAALLSAAIGGDFPYKGYKTCVFPDKIDLFTPKIGYLPGYIKEEEKLEANLKKLGMEIVNTEMDDSTYVDRELITGASPKASQTLGVVACKFLADKFDFKITV